MERLQAVVGPIATNVYVLADPASREAIAIDTATLLLAWIADALDQRGWTLKLIVSTHGHWDHIGDNAAVAAHTGATSRFTRPTARCSRTRPRRSRRRSSSSRRCPRSSWPRGARSAWVDPPPGAAHARAHAGLRVPPRRRRRRALQRRHAVRGWPGPGRSPGRRRGQMAGSLGAPRRPRGPGARAPRTRLVDDDRARAGVAGPRAARGPPADLTRSPERVSRPGVARLERRRAEHVRPLERLPDGAPVGLAREAERLGQRVQRERVAVRPDGGQGPPQPIRPKSLRPCAGASGDTPTPRASAPVDVPAMSSTIQWTQPRASGSSTRSTRAEVSSGAPTQFQLGEPSSPSQV